MTHVASEMQRDSYFKENNIPLLIGGATTSRAHTAVKISDHYDGPVIHVSDASRSVSIMQSLMDPKQKIEYLINLSKDYENVKQLHAKKKGPSYISIKDARENKLSLKFKPIKPKFIGRRIFNNIDIQLISEYIDWAPFFQTWDLHGRYPAILEDELVGESAKSLFKDAKKMLDKIINEKKLKANGVIGFYPANSVNDDDIELYADHESSDPIFTYFGLRQQTQKPIIKGIQKPNISLADYIAPKESGVKDYIGLFAVTAGINVTTPQHVALDDSARSLNMFKKLNIPIAGIIENMSGFVCPNCNEESDIFGKGTCEELATQYETSVMGMIPIEPAIREGGDNGKPIVYDKPESVTAKRYLESAEKLWKYIESVEGDNSSIQPTTNGVSACSTK
jgi:cobalamin-dependent methionine synthase I